jgi:Tol biopolymer transport system component
MTLHTLARVARAAAVSQAFAVTLFAGAAEAQYFGSNRVQYDRLDFKVLTTEHFDIYYHQGEEEAVKLAARMAERWYTRLSTFFDHQLSTRQALILYSSHPLFRQTNVGGAEPGEGTGGFTEGMHRRIVLPFAGGLAETDHVLGHELVHAFQFDVIAAAAPGGATQAQAALRLPLWFIEGMAEFLSIGAESTLTAMWMRDATARGDLPAIEKLDDPRYFPYRYGHAFWAFVAGRYGDAAVARLLRGAANAKSYDDLFGRVLGVDAKQLTEAWHEATRQANARWLESTQRPSEIASSLVVEREGEQGINLGPALSPDGSRVVFLSSRALFSIDLFLADARTGKIVRRIVKTDTDPHFDSLQFLDSAGAWHPDGKRFAFSAFRAGRPALVVVDVDSGRVVSEREVQGVDAAFNPSWAPDGKRLAFSGMTGGVLDLFVMDADAGQVSRLTSDAWAEIDPEWSPDGRALVFASDRFSSDLATLSFGDYRLAVLDVESRQVRALPTFDRGRSTSPYWLPDGRSVAFIADPDGIPNLYLRAADGQIRRLTNVQSGISGITPLTPALSVGAASGRLAFSVFEGDSYNIYVADSADRLAQRAVEPTQGVLASSLPPLRERRDRVTAIVENAERGLPAATAPMAVEDYSPRLRLDFVTQPTGGVGVDRFGAFAAGGIAFGFSDVLGNHQLITSVNANSRFQDVGGAALYINRSRRLNWGAVVERAPYLSGGYGQGYVIDGGQLQYVEQELLAREISNNAAGILQYPFSRSLRLEGSAGIRHLSYDYQLTRRVYDPASGSLIDELEEDLPAPDSMTLGQFSTALVRDTSIMGATGPLAGQRFRVEVSQTTGTLDFTGVLADGRQYVMPFRPLTLAGRVLHYGRYGSSSEDPRMSLIYLGTQGLVRGYDVGSFDANECESLELQRCDAFDRLLGSRVVVANVEARAPLFGLFSRGGDYYGFFPVDIVAFFDAGLAWTRGETPWRGDASREWARSAGIALRANLMGFAIAEVNYVRPLDRPDRGWRWQFNFVPGF